MGAFIIGLCFGVLEAGGFVSRIAAPTLGFPNPCTDATAVRLCPRAKVATPTEDSGIWESWLENSATDEYQAGLIRWLGGAARIQPGVVDE